MRPTRTLLATIAVGAALALAGCGDDADEPTTTAAAPAKTAAESPAPVEGEPIVIGMLNQDNAASGSFPEMTDAAKAAVEYVNRELGGAAGRPLKLETCATTGTPESSSRCANQIVAAKPLLTTFGFDLGSPASVPIFEKSGVPYVGGVPSSPAEFTAANSWQFTAGTISGFPAQSLFMADQLQAKKVSILYADVPQGLDAAKNFGEAVLKARGVSDVKLVPAKIDTTDFTASLSAASSGDPDAIMVIFVSQQCSRIMRAAQSLGVKAPTFYPGACNDSKLLGEIGAAAEGLYFNAPFVPWADEQHDEVRTYREKYEQYGSGTPNYSTFSQDAFANVLNIRELIEQLDGAEPTPKAIEQALLATKDQKAFMSHPYTCDRKLIPAFPAICNANERIVKIVDGKPQDAVTTGDGWIDAAPIVRGD